MLPILLSLTTCTFQKETPDYRELLLQAVTAGDAESGRALAAERNRLIARRVLDFLSGVAYANQGKIKRVANNTYIITPYNVGISGDLIDELENNGMYF